MVKMYRVVVLVIETTPMFIFDIAPNVASHELAQCGENDNIQRQGETVRHRFRDDHPVSWTSGSSCVNFKRFLMFSCKRCVVAVRVLC